MDIVEFKKQIKKVSGKRTTTIKNSYGNNEAVLYYNKNVSKESKLTDQQFRKLITRVNELMAEDLLNIGNINLPAGLGRINLYSKERKPKIVNGKLVYNAPINWNKTLELWASDPESRVAKTTVKCSPGKSYSIKYHSVHRKFVNRRYIQFTVTRALKLKLKDRIINKENIPCIHKII